MRLGLSLGYLTGQTSPADLLAWTREADRLGFAVAWVAEAYGSDAPSMLGWLAGQTAQINVGAAVMQIPGRTPAATAMTAATLDTISAGRFRLGLGVSGPQVSEGWHGVRFDHPLARTREYVDIVRLALSRAPVTYAGAHYTLPLPDGPGKALRLGFRPPRTDIPIYLAAVGPQNMALAGEIADGWLGIFCAADAMADPLTALRRGAARAGRDLAGFDVVASVPVVVGDDVDACADRVRAYAALYVGGMGSRERNFYRDLAARLGYPQQAAQVQELFLAGRQRDAAAALPLEFLDRTSLLGPTERIAAGLRRYAQGGVTTLSVSLFATSADEGIATLRAVARAYEIADL